jgi:peptidyl-dipeptidase Dcp
MNMNARLLLPLLPALAACALPLAHAADDVNPLLQESTLPYQFPPFDQIKNEHFQPAIEQGMAEQLKEIEQIAAQKDKPTLENTIVAMRAQGGRLLARAYRVFCNLNGTKPIRDAAHRQGALAEALRASRCHQS